MNMNVFNIDDCQQTQMMNMSEHDDLPIKDGDCPMKLPECIPSGNQTCN